MIDKFVGPYRFLSNFWPATVVLDGVAYPSVEHAYVAAKTVVPSLRTQIAATVEPGAVKRFGRTFALRPDWEDVRLAVMEDLVRQKFSVEPLRSMLLATGDVKLVEGNTWNDHFWGVCRGRGENHLGRILMHVREQIQ